MTVKPGLVAALDSLGATAEPSAAGEGEQLDLLAMPLPEAPGLAIGAAVEPRGPGRPAGSRNRSTDEWRRYLLGRYGSPLERLLQVAMADTRELAKAVGLSVGAVWQEQLHAREVCARYLHQAMPQAVDLGGAPAAVIQMYVDQRTYDLVQGGGGRDDGAVRFAGGPAGESVADQGVGEGDRG